MGIPDKDLFAGDDSMEERKAAKGPAKKFPANPERQQPLPAVRPSRKAAFEADGFGSVHVEHDPNQGEMFPETDQRPPFRRLSSYHDMTDAQRAHGEQLTRTTVSGVRRTAAGYLDRAFSDAKAQRGIENDRRADVKALMERRGESTEGHDLEPDTSPIYAAGQDWYHGGGLTGNRDTEASKISRLADEHGVPRHTVAAIRATVAKKISAPAELVAAHDILSQRGKAPEDITSPRSGAFGDAVVAGAHHLNDIHADPLDTKGYPSGNESLGSHKASSYYQEQTYPNEWDTRIAADTHMFRALTPLSDEEIKRIQAGSSGNTKNQGRVAPAHRIVVEGTRQAGAALGLDPTEAQTTIWHQKKREDDMARRPAILQSTQMRLFK